MDGFEILGVLEIAKQEFWGSLHCDDESEDKELDKDRETIKEKRITPTSIISGKTKKDVMYWGN